MLKTLRAVSNASKFDKTWQQVRVISVNVSDGNLSIQVARDASVINHCKPNTRTRGGRSLKVKQTAWGVEKPTWIPKARSLLRR